MDNIIAGIKNVFKKLIDIDGMLFQLSQGIEIEYPERKLHEVCINHKLSIYLEEYLLPVFSDYDQTLFIDIEFNREGDRIKEISLDGKDERVRPDIIIHNRKTGKEKCNILVIECKKDPVNEEDFKKDKNKINALMTDPSYEYSYGLQVIYSNDSINGKLYYKEDGDILSIAI